jgi:type II restriction enzyme
MNLDLDPSVALGYKSRTQIARVITEHWASDNLFCLTCASERIEQLNPNAQVSDFRCPACTAKYQLKSSAKTFGGSVSNSAYQPKMDAIQRGQVPHYAFLRYSLERWRVTDLFIVPGYFFTPAVIQKRAPLRSTARRAGWVGSNILLRALPTEARVQVVLGEQALQPEVVRDAWGQFEFLAKPESAGGGWGADTLMCVREMQRSTGSNEFSLQRFYGAFDSRLAALHPENRNVQPKIRQQLQVLRDNGVLQFLGDGRYHVLR